MGLLDGILDQLGSNIDIGSIAQQVGIDPALAEKAVAALGQSHAEPGDTLAGAAARTGLDVGQLGQIAQQLGGEGGLAQIASALQDNPQAASILNMLDRDGDGNPFDDIAGMASGLLGKK
ncbi:MAG: hypothetical protein GXC70_05755 [Sphingomonadaceae bacterium]|nr:hypothetical protein [Sphingomonadaceae bacterium]